jgi:hypothetical protein
MIAKLLRILRRCFPTIPNMGSGLVFADSMPTGGHIVDRDGITLVRREGKWKFKHR